ncbi:MAG TPA: Fic family protein [Solirubrobacterales bacterium]|nr:Fic family protein [Solirubrobacterales bacterium]
MHVEKAPAYLELSFNLGAEATVKALQALRDAPAEDRYLHWDKLRHLDPPAGLSHEEWWLALKARRAAEARLLPWDDKEGTPFRYGLPDLVLRRLHRVDQRASGEVAMDEVVTSEKEAGQRFLVNSLMEEAIRSSQLEGATTSRRVAKEMLRSGREPRDRGERMIANNYRALQFAREEMGDRLDLDALLELHRIVTDGTLDNPSAAGRLQQPGEERVAVFDRDEDERPIHIPPAAEELPERMRMLCDFANEGGDDDRFVHPVIRAILLHFWLGYDHPFEDGNGRTARVLFSWLMQQRGYWLIEYLPISPIIREAPAKYARAFIESETDEGDVTYFLIHQLESIEKALDRHDVYIRRKIAEVRDVERLLHDADGLNYRQLALLTDAIRNPGGVYTFGSHATSHRVSHETARSDLSDLDERGLLLRRRKGRGYTFEPVPDLAARLKESPHER